MEFLKMFLPIVIYFLLIVLLVVLIIIGIKAIYLMNRVNTVVDDVEKKVQSLNGLFSVLGNISSRINYVYDKVTDTALGLFDRLFSRKPKRKSKEDIDE